ncbi:hypothetical protein SKAU_G00026810 [Synaphobranchus kaupii]|uniref:Uncharacterized protein n=1 Tax=Synaphobranchus kaupii TaxID=118154 RepID=A0A9Q1GE45_SYNKA|nr:hypothetical protein SKAU_G00026810 [Synaphobranchus kaupii]
MGMVIVHLKRTGFSNTGRVYDESHTLELTSEDPGGRGGRSPWVWLMRTEEAFHSPPPGLLWPSVRGSPVLQLACSESWACASPFTPGNEKKPSVHSRPRRPFQLGCCPPPTLRFSGWLCSPRLREILALHVPLAILPFSF